MKTVLYWICRIVPLVTKYWPKAKAFVESIEELKELKNKKSLNKSWRDSIK